MVKSDTIAAIATAMSPSGIGIIRLSGEDAFQIIDKVYRSKNGNKKLSECESHTVHYGYVYDGEELIDEVMVLIMKAPKTYTTENTVEIDCHGGVYVMQKILETVIKYGARPAEPGEFTKRAFLNGRIDLTQAESVIDVINSKNNFALKSSVNQLNGVLKDKISEVRSSIIHEIAFIESALDDPEHISLEGYPKQLEGVVTECLNKIELLLKTSDNGRILKEGIQTVIVGKPNAGKSSLLNALLKEERAIVTNIAGTTRDILEEQINLNGITLNIIDTAGIRDTSDIVEKIGVEKARDFATKADLVLYVIDASTSFDDSDYAIMEMLKDKKAIILLNKSDLEKKIEESDVKAHLNHHIISTSIIDNKGILELEDAIKEMFFKGEVTFNDEIYITNMRQKNSLQRAKESMILVLESIHNLMPEDFYSIDLMNCYESLGNIVGESLEDDLVNEIFSKFCMGK